MNYTKRLNDLREEVINSLCGISEFPEGLFPHCVYVEEASEESLECGNSIYKAYNLVNIFPDGTCLLEQPATGENEMRNLHEINIEWLITVWEYYKDLSGNKEPQMAKKSLYVFVYPVNGFERHMDDEKVLALWENGDAEKYTPDEFAELVNDEMFNEVGSWIRFIEVED